MIKPNLLILSFITSLLLSSQVHAGWLDSFSKVIKPMSEKKLGETQIGQGLKEALSVSVDKAVQSASKEGGFNKNQAIRIEMPEQLAMMETVLRKVGMGAKVDEFEQGVNRAAEQAAPQAKKIFLNALFNMSIDDARLLLKGDNTAATQYFRKQTFQDLYKTFQPQLQKEMSKHRVSQTYDQMIAAYNKIPLAKKPKAISADEYATNKALDGLFYLVAEEEKKIRTDPKARVTDLLKTVFA